MPALEVDVEARQSEKREHWNMLTSGGGRTPPILKPTRSHREGRWMTETNDTSATNETGGYSVTRPLIEETMRSTLSSPKQAVEGDDDCHRARW